jgi:hypothetical protein
MRQLREMNMNEKDTPVDETVEEDEFVSEDDDDDDEDDEAEVEDEDSSE